ncbi:MAG TPA: TetR/AcrR family transcriptional regulator C-terminal ligand-binding domain-containing protein [Xanthobacteraceae bacterium]|nr:TetR/AcrR family transcriptional regulator C-terminal ligand-binding domain-containing protein [Xanthobacteraceae bacterium]
MTKKTPTARPGGRSSRVKEAVFAAVEEFLAENPGELPSMATIAERAAVNPTSLYRRWGDARKLVGAVAVDSLMRELPVPDTGTLRGDLVGWATAAAKSLSKGGTVSMLRVMAAVPATNGKMANLRDLPIGRRVAELDAMLARGRKRGEKAPDVVDVLDLVLAPIYLRALFMGPVKTTRGVDRLVDRALALAELQRPPRG